MSNVDAIFKLKEVDVATVSDKKLRELVEHLQSQMNDRYMYLVGEWRNSHRAKSTRDGKFVSKDALIQYLNKRPK